MQGKMDDVAGKVWTMLASNGSGHTPWFQLAIDLYFLNEISMVETYEALQFWIKAGEVEESVDDLGCLCYRIKDCTCQLSEQEPAQSVTMQPKRQSQGERKSGTTSAISNGYGHSGSKQMRKVRKPLKKSSKKLRSTKGKSRE